MPKNEIISLLEKGIKGSQDAVYPTRFDYYKVQLANGEIIVNDNGFVVARLQIK